MAWVCVRCQKKIYEPRIDASRPKFGMVWKYVKVRHELTCDIKNLKDVKPKQVVTHLHCEDGELEGFKDRMKNALGIPPNRDHPLLI
jgi:hypothetical protein